MDNMKPLIPPASNEAKISWLRLLLSCAVDATWSLHSSDQAVVPRCQGDCTMTIKLFISVHMENWVGFIYVHHFLNDTVISEFVNEQNLLTHLIFSASIIQQQG